ncbi:hypothetical protein POVWA2_011120 [Plasmodium ovale wallikeri]|uniref:Uncharacterized protein n=1 Tax=Plasmodium ovale wallikeri TaxID=864142 RepID=A0A1A8YMX2_PLAOA|nr:hypothetical protein POVWA2_011120 [Plasmodium ovale wallikeri]
MKAFDRGGNTLEKTSLRGIQGMTLAKLSMQILALTFSRLTLFAKKKKGKERGKEEEKIYWGESNNDMEIKFLAYHGSVEKGNSITAIAMVFPIES